METQTTQNSQPVQQTTETPGFISILKISFQIFIRNWKSFIKMTLALLLPGIILMGILIAIGITFKANAAPKIPDTVMEDQNTVPQDTALPVTDAVLPEVTDAPAAVDENSPVSVQGDVTASGDIASPENIPTAVNPDETGAANTTETMQDKTADTETPEQPAMMVPDTGQSSSFSSIIPFAGLAGLFVGVMGIIFAILFIPFFLYMMVAGLSMIRLTVLVNQEQEIKIWGIIKWAFGKLGSYIMLTIRIMIYIAWPVLAVSLVIFILGIAHIQIPMMNIIYFALSIAAFVMTIIRAPRVSFAKYVLAEKDCSSKEAMEDSISAAKGHWGKIIGYLFLLGLLVGIVSGIINAIFTKISPSTGAIITGLISIIISYVAIIFVYGLYNVCRILNENK